MFTYVDAHCHIPADVFGDYSAVLERALAVGVKRVLVNGIDDKDNRAIANWQHPILRRAFGAHPCYSHTHITETLAWIRAHKHLCVAIGEIGLDAHHRPDTVPEQEGIFSAFLAESSTLRLPVIIHSRKAEQRVLHMVKDHDTPVVLHAFGGNKQLLEQAIKMKCVLTVASNVSRSEQLQYLVDKTPLQQLLTETDAPYLRRDPAVASEPAHVVGTVEVIARIKGITVQECANLLFMNYQRIFKS